MNNFINEDMIEDEMNNFINEGMFEDGLIIKFYQVLNNKSLII